jgi:hypothetical protein
MPDLCLEPLRQAVASGEFPRALVLWNEYVARFAGALQRGEVTLGQWREVEDFVAWARNLALCSRAYAQDRLNSLHVTDRYSQYPCSQASLPSLIQARL